MINHSKQSRLAEGICAEKWHYPSFYGIVCMAFCCQFTVESSDGLFFPLGFHRLKTKNQEWYSKPFDLLSGQH